MEIYILDNACFEKASSWSCSVEEGIVFTVKQRQKCHQYCLAIGDKNSVGEGYLRRLISASEQSTRNIILRLKTDAAAKSNKVTVQLGGFFTEEQNKGLRCIDEGGGVEVQVRVSLSMTKYALRENKIQVLERGFIKGGLMELSSNPQLTGIKFPSSILETCYSDGRAEEHRHFYLSGTVTISLTCDCHLPCGNSVRSSSVPKKIFTDQIHSDVDIICEGKVIRSHKAFLAAQSPVFAAMFLSGMQEPQTNSIEIVDIPYAALQKLVTFLYDEIICEGINQYPKLAVDVLVASNKYLISELEERMKDIILNESANWCDLETALQLYIFTRNLDSFSDLKMKSVQFIKSKSGEILNSEGFKNLFADKEKHEVGLELFSLLAFVPVSNTSDDESDSS